MNALIAAAIILVLVLLGSVAGQSSAGTAAVTVVLPYIALVCFIVGVSYRVIRWALTPVPFRIPTTCGQERSLPWIRTAPIDNPSNGFTAAIRVALEVLLFRSLLRNSRAIISSGRLASAQAPVLWLGALAFHWSLLVIVLRHLRFVVEPAPAFVATLASIDGLLQIGAPALLMTDVILIASVAYLLLRRWWDPALRYLSLVSDYLALLLILAIGVSGMLMRYVTRVDVISVKQLALGLVSFHPFVPGGASPVFLVHLLLVCVLAIYIPMSKLMHFGGVFLSPTRNLANNSRRVRHVNPWNAPVPTHTYAEWEQEYSDKLTLAGIPLDKASDGGRAAAD